MPEVSIVIPVYNVENYLEKCMQSVLAQTVRDFEVILVNDGSTDGSGVLCDVYAKKDERIRVIHKENGGLSDARNTGIRCAAGNYICFIDSDDYVADFFLEKRLAAAARHNADIVLFDYVFVEEDGRPLYRYQAHLEAEQTLTLETSPTLLNTTPSACNKLYRRSLFHTREAEFPKGRLYEDLATIPKLFSGATIVYIDLPLYFYVNHMGSIMHRKAPDYGRRYDDRLFAVNSIIRFYTAAEIGEHLKENLEFLAIYHIYFMLSIETIAEDPKSSWLKRYREYIQTEYPHYRKNKYIPTLFTRRERIKFRLLDGGHYSMIVLLGKLKGVLH